MATYNIDNLPERFASGDIVNCPYSGGEKSITLPKGTYKLECWGAKGGNGQSTNSTGRGALGGYSFGNFATNGATLFLNCGGSGKNVSPSSHNDVAGGYNGGGDGQYHSFTSGLINVRSGGGSGGGATHIAFHSGLLNELESYKHQVIMVAGGGGAGYGTSVYYRDGGAGGGISGYPSAGYDGDTISSPGTQTSGGAGGSSRYAVAQSGYFGHGGNAAIPDNNTAQCGGGGGWYGGGAGDACGGSGGSGYVADTDYAVDPVYLTQAGTIVNVTAYNPEGIVPNPDTAENGYIRITVIDVPTLLIPVKVNGHWADGTSAAVKVNGSWKNVTKTMAKLNGHWK